MNKQIDWLRGDFRRGRTARFTTSRTLLMLMTCVFLGCGTHPDASATCPAIEIGAVADAPGDSTRPATLDDGKQISLTRTPLITNADITGAKASLTEGQWGLNVDVSEQGAKRVQDFSKQNVGRTMAFLVEGKVHSTPRILDPITGKGFLIGTFDQAEAERLATAINNGCKH